MNLNREDISDTMCAAVARQHPFGFVLVFMGDTHKSVMEQCSFFEKDQSNIEGVINPY